MQLGSIATHRDRQNIAPHWRSEAALAGRLFDHLLHSYESYSQKWEYVRMNPVRAKLCETPEAWPYQGEIVRIPFA